MIKKCTCKLNINFDDEFWRKFENYLSKKKDQEFVWMAEIIYYYFAERLWDNFKQKKKKKIEILLSIDRSRHQMIKKAKKLLCKFDRIFFSYWWWILIMMMLSKLDGFD